MVAECNWQKHLTKTELEHLLLSESQAMLTLGM